MSRLGRTLLILIVAAAVSAGVYAWTRSGKKDASGPKQVEVTSGAIVEKAVAVGQIQPRQKFQVKSKISGIVRRALVQIGDTVKAGDPLFEIAADPTPLEKTEVDRRVESAEASSGARRPITSGPPSSRDRAFCRSPTSTRRRKRTSLRASLS